MPLQGGYPGRPGPHPAPSGLEIGLAGGPADHFSRSHCNLLAPCLLASGLLASGLLASGLDALRITADTSAVLDAAFNAVFPPCLQKGHSLRSRTGATT